MKTRILLTCLAIFLFGLTARAMSLAPALFDVAMNPGEMRALAFSITNDEATEQTYYFSIQKFIPKGNSGQQEFLPPSDISGLPSWIYFNHASVTLRPGESTPVPFTIRVPAGALAGGYYAAVFFSTQPPAEVARTNVVTASRTGSLILLRVNGPVVERLQLVDFALESSPQSAHLPVAFRAMLQNEGNVHLMPEGNVTITNMFGNVVAKIPLNPQHANILPASNRQFQLVWQKDEARAGQGFWHEVGEEWRNFGLGKYTASLQLTGSGTQDVHAESVRFSVWPWHLPLVVFILLILLVVLAQAYRRWVIYRLTVKE